jgi:hypothetical protein
LFAYVPITSHGTKWETIRTVAFGADQWMEKIEKAIAPFIRDRGFDWELHYGQTPRELWRVQGLKPPKANSEAERVWVKENRASPFED